MRFGCCVNMLVPFGQGTGAEYVEPRCCRRIRLFGTAGGAHRGIIGSRVYRASPARGGGRANNGVVQRLFSNHNAADGPGGQSCRSVELCGRGTESRQEFRRQIRRLRQRPGADGAGRILYAAARDQLVGLLEDLVPLAEKHRLTIAIEALNRTECNIVLSLIEAEKLAKRINHPHPNAGRLLPPGAGAGTN